MKIGFVTPWFGEFAGGAEREARFTAQRLKQAGLDVEILTTCCRNPFESWWKDYFKPGDYQIDNLLVRRFRVNKGNEEEYHKLNYKIITKIQLFREEELSYFKNSINSDELVEFIIDNKTEYIFVLIPYFYGLIYWAFKAAIERCLLIPCLHDEPQARFSTTGELLENCFVLFHAPEELELASRIFGKKINRYEITGEGVTNPGFFNGEDFKAKYKIQNDYILYVGRKDKGKNLHVLIDYFIQYLESTKDDLKLVLVGHGDDSIIHPNANIINLPLLDEQDKNNAYNGAFATCNLSENESFSLVIMESWLTSTPVIVSALCPVTRSHCKRSNAGLFIADQYEFIESLIFLRENETIRREMGLQGKKYVLDNYSWDVIISKIMRIIKEKEMILNENID